MTEQEGTGWGIIIVVLFLLWWLSKNALGFLHGETAVVQSGIVGGQQNEPTVTTYPDTGGCCS
jgi:hypothetical protein